MLEKAIRVCEATFGNIYRWDGEAFYLLATKNTPQAFAEYRRSASPVRPAPDTLFGRLAAARKLIHIPDLVADHLYSEKKTPSVVAAVELGGVRTILVVPMLKEDELIGCVFLFRQKTNPFTEKQIDLVKNFAAQAVIAVENARLLKELRQKLAVLSPRPVFRQRIEPGRWSDEWDRSQQTPTQCRSIQVTPMTGMSLPRSQYASRVC
jgi:GAF domain-containing protein